MFSVGVLGVLVYVCVLCVNCSGLPHVLGVMGGMGVIRVLGESVDPCIDVLVQFGFLAYWWFDILT